MRLGFRFARGRITLVACQSFNRSHPREGRHKRSDTPEPSNQRRYDLEKNEIRLGSEAVDLSHQVLEVDDANGRVVGTKPYEQKLERIGLAGDKFDLATMWLQIALVFGAISLILNSEELKMSFTSSRDRLADRNRLRHPGLPYRALGTSCIASGYTLQPLRKLTESNKQSSGKTLWLSSAIRPALPVEAYRPAAHAGNHLLRRDMWYSHFESDSHGTDKALAHLHKCYGLCCP